jgi:hypothetical protein
MSESLGRSLLASSVRPDAGSGPMVREGYEGMRTRAKSIAPIDRRRLAEVVDRLIELCTAIPQATRRSGEVRPRAWTNSRPSFWCSDRLGLTTENGRNGSP